MTEFQVLVDVSDSKLSFERHIRMIATSASSEIGNRRMTLCLFSDPV